MMSAQIIFMAKIICAHKPLPFLVIQFPFHQRLHFFSFAQIMLSIGSLTTKMHRTKRILFSSIVCFHFWTYNKDIAITFWVVSIAYHSFLPKDPRVCLSRLTTKRKTCSVWTPVNTKQILQNVHFFAIFCSRS